MAKGKKPETDKEMKAETEKLEDLVKVEIGAHIDGFPASCAHSFVIGGKTKGK